MFFDKLLLVVVLLATVYGQEGKPRSEDRLRRYCQAPPRTLRRTEADGRRETSALFLQAGARFANPATFEEALAEAERIENLLAEAAADRLIHPSHASAPVAEYRERSSSPPRSPKVNRASGTQIFIAASLADFMLHM
ncbi:unnamed protein product [Cylicocyclus nassatus]|uniref:Uncharacterized protein n=1 Tax=Cylicocyclus nassatus TaxID=53992 RepID=A0AA36DUN9_CYLNA|nr:unnamed protein product [Cylicocyclus nassatus]